MATGLFASPQEVQAAEQARFRQQFGGGNRGAFTGLGNELGNALQRGLFGTDTRSQAVQAAQQIQELVAGIDYTDNGSIASAANRMADAGFQDQAQNLMNQIQPIQKPDAIKVGEEVRTITAPDGNAKNFLVEIYSDKTIKKIAEVGNDGDTSQSPLIRFTERFASAVGVGAEDGMTKLKAIINLPQFQSVFPNGDADVEDLDGMLGLIQERANQLKQLERDSVRKLITTPGLQLADRLALQQEVALHQGLSDGEYMTQAMQAMITAGEFAANIDESLVGADEVKIDPLAPRDTASLLEGVAREEGIRKLEREKTLEDPRAAPPGKFSPNRLDQQEMMDVVQLITTNIDSPEAIRVALPEAISDERFQQSLPFWSYIASNPDFARGILLRKQGQARQSFIKNEKAKVGPTSPIYWEMNEIARYLADVKDFVRPIRGGGRGRQTP